MLYEKEINLSQQIKNMNLFQDNMQLNGAFFLIKKKKDNKSEIHNRSIEFFKKPFNLLNKLEKLIEKSNTNKNKNINKNTEKKLSKRPFNQFFENDFSKNIFPKKRLLENILLNKRSNVGKENYRANSLNSKTIKLSGVPSKSNLLINELSTNDLFDSKKMKIFKVKNDYFDGDKTGSHINNTLSQNKLEQINMNKTALLQKIKFESLKKFCKNVRFADKKIGFNLIKEKQQHSTKNEVKKNNCEEIKIGRIKEKVRNYFIGRFENIKKYFENWDEKKLGKLDFKDIHQYINKKIKYKISENETKKLLHSNYNKNYLDLDNFRQFFFEKTPKDKLFIQGNQLFEYHEKLIKNLSELNSINRGENNNCNISFFEKVKLNEIISLISTQKNSILSQINAERVELTFIEFNSIIKSIIKNGKYNFDKEIKKLFYEYKDKDSDLINIYNFFEKINIKKEENANSKTITHPIKNIRKNINPRMKSFDNKNKKPNVVLNSRNIKSNDFAYKESKQSKTNFVLDKPTNKEIENNKNINININGLNNLNKLKNIRINFLKEKKREIKNSFNSKFSKVIDYALNDNKKINNENDIENSKLIDILPEIKDNKKNKNKNKNSDIIEFL